MQQDVQQSEVLLSRLHPVLDRIVDDDDTAAVVVVVNTYTLLLSLLPGLLLPCVRVYVPVYETVERGSRKLTMQPTAQQKSGGKVLVAARGTTRERDSVIKEEMHLWRLSGAFVTNVQRERLCMCT